MTAFNEFDPLRRVAPAHARDAFGETRSSASGGAELHRAARYGIGDEQYDLFLDLIRSWRRDSTSFH